MREKDKEKRKKMEREKWKVYGEIKGKIIMIGLGQIGRGKMKMIERNLKLERQKMVVIEKREKKRKIIDEKNIRLIKKEIKREN